MRERESERDGQRKRTRDGTAAGETKLFSRADRMAVKSIFSSGTGRCTGAIKRAWNVAADLSGKDG